MNGNKPATPTDWVDPDDAPELSDDLFARADEFQGSKLIRRGRPPTGMPSKQVTTIRLSPEVIDAFKATGAGRQTRIDAALKDWLKTHSPG
ncbi:BrnA antitoxin family protein [Sphaerotilus microaerophilus]|uniref:BrnA antitoxin of type II toxin-antitoxin system n=1 Tax=Sphaerotilus microaerophilus TaxID=2914710 RepID=A0ABM7YH45_9BURK|nr:BrnA antitoxin family protein [Sphaerotilus sp. FB-5]BDI03511.1 hypothetical protein CATMQ487_04810 [Sphaerotilus sp. FB-5]